ncbi:hypothetical protein FACS189442_4170 [Spirochaetia bacterium]|nr:hypothetical protein FACS189442_4170 [Spirochaetia bacterium]
MNNQQVLPESLFDSLSIGVKLYNYFDGFNRNEIQLFSYFASVLFPYTKEPLSEWKYKYMIDKSEYPFSDKINMAIDSHLINGNFEEKEKFIIMTTRGMRNFDDIKELKSFQNREKAINASCTTSIMIPFKETEEALLKDPEYNKQKIKNNPDWVNQDFAINRIKEVSSALGVPIDNIVASSVSWIKYLSLVIKGN